MSLAFKHDDVPAWLEPTGFRRGPMKMYPTK